MQFIEYRARHAPLLAALWNESDSAWPGGLVRLRPKTAAEWKEWEARIDPLGRFVAFDRGKAVGYVRMFEWFDSPDAAYVQFLNVHPAYHGKGIGKALLGKALGRTIARGYPRVDLHTWPGNDKAMPLYKRTGYMWVPGSHAYLQNYLPLILGYEPARSFFARADWYESLKRDLTRDHDRDRVRGIDAFVYRFEDGRRKLESVIDRSARGIMAFEDSDLRVESWIPGAVLVEGLQGTIHWFVRNKGKGPASVAIETQAEPRISIRNPKPFVLRAGASRELTAPIRIPRSYPDAPEGWASPAVETTFVVGGRALSLRSGFRPKPALAIEWEEDAPSIAAPGSRTLHLVLRNQASRPLRGSLRIAAEAIRVNPSRVSLRLSREGVRRLPIRLENGGAVDRAVPLQVTFSSGRTRVQKTLVVPCLTPGGRVAYADEKEWVLSSPRIRLVSKAVAGTAAVYSTDGKKLFEANVFGGQPMIPNDAWQQRWAGSVPSASTGTPEIVRTFRSRKRPGMLLEQKWRLAGDRLLECHTAIENRGSAPWTASVALDVNRSIDSAAATIPTSRGPVTEAMMETEWPDERQDVPLGRLLEEGWIHVGDDERGYGVVWSPPAPKQVELTGWNVPLSLSPQVRVAPRGRKEFPPVWFLATPDWREVRALWTHVAGRKTSHAAGAIGAVRVDAEPVTALAFPAMDLRATVRSDRRRPTGGTLRLEVPSGLRASPNRWKVGGVHLEADFPVRSRLVATRPVTGRARFVLEDERNVQAWDVPVVGGPSRGSIRFSGPASRRRLDNGLFSFDAAPAHGASLVSLRCGGHEYLVSSFPKAGSFAWFRPFYGGIFPSVYQEDWPGDLFRERFRIREARRGAWRGLRLFTGAGKSSLPTGTRVTVEYLTRPRCPLLIASLEVANRTRERAEFTAGLWAFLGYDGKARCEVAFDRLKERTWKSTARVGWSGADGGFAVFRAPRAAKSVALVAVAPADLDVFALRGLGHHGSITRELDLDPGQSGIVLGALAVVPPKAASGYRNLRSIDRGAMAATRVL